MSQNQILLIEDETPIAEALLYALKTDGFIAERASTISQAKVLMQKQKFDLLILDVGLPDGLGFDFCKELRQNKNNTPVLFLTARASEVDRIVGLELGGDDYVTKPFSPREICARIRSILRRTKNNSNHDPSETFSFGPFQVDDSKKRILFKGQLLELSRYEYGVLLFLIQSKGRVLSREQIMESVWSDPGMSLDRTVDTHIKQLRQKLKSIYDGEIIQTHRGLGYSVSEE